MSRWYTQISWEEVPHLDDKAKADLLRTIPEYQRDARSTGVPSLGAGLIYQISENDVRVKDFPIPDHWKRCWALDSGWNWTAAIWGAYDPDAHITYLYSCYKRGQAEPSVHADAIRSRGAWIPGVGDAADINKLDGRQLISIYKDTHKLNIELPIKAVEAGIYKVWTQLTAGGLKVFASLSPWFEEYRFYARDEKGKIIKKNDHLMDATRYLIMSGLDRAITKPFQQEDKPRFISPEEIAVGWMSS